MATNTNTNDEIFAQAALEGFVSTLVPVGAYANDYSAETVKKGDQVLVPLIGSLTATTFNGAYNVSGGTASVVTVNIDKHKHIPVSMTDIEAAATSIIRLESFGRQAGAALGLLVFQDIMSLVTTANYSLATAVSVVDFAIAQIRAGRLMLSQNKVPAQMRNMVLDVEPFDNLLGISNFLQVNLSGNQETLREGRIGRALGLDIFETNGLPGTGSVMGFIGHADAIAVAARYLKPQRPEEYIEARPLTDDQTKLTIGLRRHYDPNTGIEYVNLECNYGYSKGITNGLRVIKRLN